MNDQTTLERLRTILAKAKGYHDALTAWRFCPAAHPEKWFLEQRDCLEDATLALSRALDPSVEGIPGQVSRKLTVLRESTGKHVREFEQDDRPVLGDDERAQVGAAINVLDRYVAPLRRRVPGGMRSAAAGLCPYKRLVLDLVNNSLTLDDGQASYALTFDQTQFIKALVEANGGYVPAKNVIPLTARVDRVKRRLPTQVQTCIETKRGVGSRLLVTGVIS